MYLKIESVECVELSQPPDEIGALSAEKPVPAAAGGGFRGYGYGSAQSYPPVTRVDH